MVAARFRKQGGPFVNWIRSMLLLLAALIGTLLAQPAVTAQAVRFQAVDIFIDSKETPLAAYQLEFSVKTGDAKMVGVEGGEHSAFKDAPFYDPKAIQHERVIIAAFTTAADKLPKGKTRVATIHLQVTGERNPDYVVKLETAATLDGRKIVAETTYEERKPE
jgi:hypothetical protein